SHDAGSERPVKRARGILPQRVATSDKSQSNFTSAGRAFVKDCAQRTKNRLSFVRPHGVRAWSNCILSSVSLTPPLPERRLSFATRRNFSNVPQAVSASWALRRREAVIEAGSRASPLRFNRISGGLLKRIWRAILTT